MLFSESLLATQLVGSYMINLQLPLQLSEEMRYHKNGDVETNTLEENLSRIYSESGGQLECYEEAAGYTDFKNNQSFGRSKDLKENKNVRKENFSESVITPLYHNFQLLKQLGLYKTNCKGMCNYQTY